MRIVFSPEIFPSRSRGAFYVGLIAFCILPLSGCGYSKAMMAGDNVPRYDASTGTDTAIIADAGRQPFNPACRILRNEESYREVVVDSGPVILQVECSRVTGIFGERTEQLGRASLAFHAESGRHYRLKVSKDFGFPHIAVVAADDASAVIHRGLLSSQFAANAEDAYVTLISRSGDGVIPCEFSLRWADRWASSVRQRADSFVRVPYSHQIIAKCVTHAYVTGYVKERYEALVDFVPESGRLYTVHMDEDRPDVLLVTDVSSDIRTIAHVKAIRRN